MVEGNISATADGMVTVHVVRFYAPKHKGVAARWFRAPADAAAFAVGKRLYAAPAQVRPLLVTEADAARWAVGALPATVGDLEWSAKLAAANGRLGHAAACAEQIAAVSK